MDIPSLFMIPSAVSSGKVHSVFPNSTDADFDFNRDSSATRVNSQGLIETVGYFSNEKVTSLENSGFYPFNTFTDNGGGSYTCVSTNTSWAGFQQPSSETFAVTSGQVYRITFDIVKHSGTSFQFFIGNNAVGTAYTPVTAISASGSYSFDHTVTTTNSAARLVSQCNQIINFTISNISIKEIQGDRARLNYEIEGGLVNTKPSLLLEPQSTNLVTYSENFNQSVWNNFASITPIANSIISPEGLKNASTLACSGSNVFRYAFTASSSTNYVGSVFVKAKETTNDFGIQTLESGTAYKSVFNIESGVVVTQASNHTASIEDFGNGWFRCSVKFNSGSSTSNIFDFTGSQTIDIKEFYAWGAMLEQQTYATSYIPTNGSTQTRAAETCNGAGTSSILPSEEGILYAEIASLSNSGNYRLICLSDGTTSNRVFIGFRLDTGYIYYFVIVGGSTVASHITSTTSLNFSKVAVKWKANDFALWINGSEIATDTSGSSFSANTLSTINLNEGDGAGFDFYGKIRDIRVYNTKEMTDSEIDILLTKITS